jgi:hypothetical protein
MFDMSFSSSWWEGAVTDAGTGAIGVHAVEAAREQPCC